MICKRFADNVLTWRRLKLRAVNTEDPVPPLEELSPDPQVVHEPCTDVLFTMLGVVSTMLALTLYFFRGVILALMMCTAGVQMVYLVVKFVRLYRLQVCRCSNTYIYGRFLTTLCFRFA